MRGWQRRSAVASWLLLGAVLGCGGGVEALAPRPHLGVQSNEAPVAPVLLRVRPAAGARYRTRLEVDADAELFGQPFGLDYQLDQERVVTERRPDDTVVLAIRSIAGTTTFEAAGTPRTETLTPDAAPRSVVMDARGRTVEDALFAPPPSPERSEALRHIFDSLLDALAYPEDALSIGQRWGTRGTQPLTELFARGDVNYDITQELVRVEGSGDATVAVIAIRGELGTDGRLHGGPVSGTLRVEGAYTVALSDGLVRGMELRVDGRVALGGDEAPQQGQGPAGQQQGHQGQGQPPRDGAGLDVPIEGTLRYRAESVR